MIEINHDIFELILSYLDLKERFQLRLVCRKWYQLIELNFNYCKVFSTFNYDSIGYKNNSCEERRHFIEKYMNIQLCERFNILLNGLLNHFHRLSALYLHNFTFKSSQISALAELSFCGQTLDHFSITRCDLHSIKRREWNYLIIRLSPILRHLTLYLNRGMTSEKLSSIKRYCHSLEEINYDLYEIDGSFDNFIPENLIKIHLHIGLNDPSHVNLDSLLTSIENQPKLLHLKLPCVSLSYQHFESLCSKLPLLKTLEIPLATPFFDQNELGSNLSLLENLENLSLLSHPMYEEIYNIDKLLIRFIQKRGAGLRSLKIGKYQITEVALRELQEHCKKLNEFHYIHEKKCGYFYDRTEYIINNYFNDTAIRVLTKLKNIKILNISYSLLSDSELAYIIQSCHSLRKLYLNHCKYFGTKSLLAFISSALKHPNEAFRLKIDHSGDTLTQELLSTNKCEIPPNFFYDGLNFKDGEIDII